MLDGQDLTLQLLVFVVRDASSNHRPRDTASTAEGGLRGYEDIRDVLCRLSVRQV